MESEVSKFTSSFWKFEGRAVETESVEAIFALARDPAVVSKLEATLYDLSTPSSPNYGKWLTKDQLVEQFAPPKEYAQVVMDFLASYGLAGRVSELGDKVFAKIPAHLANDMFQTEFGRFRSVDDDKVVLLRVTKPYSLPKDVARVVALVDDIMRFPSIRRSRIEVAPVEQPVYLNSSVGAAPFGNTCPTKCASFTTPAVLEAQYNYSPLTTTPNAKSQVAVAEFQFQYWDQADLDSFNTNCGTKVSLDSTIGGNNEKICNTGCVESLLDIEYIGAIIAPIPLTTLYSGTYSLLNWADQIQTLNPFIWVHSVSYGNDEIQQTSNDYMYQSNTQFMQAGVLGISILFASGDQGVWGRTGPGAVFNPDFPGGSPYITVVGGTDLATKSVVGPETTWSCGGGGFSDTFPIPAYQASQVASYLANPAAKLPAASYFNSSGRAYPDVSALGGQVNSYCVVTGGTYKGVAGTSAACPVVAGLIGRLNDVRFNAGKTALGFLNPFIYATAGPAGCFNDVKDGSTNFCNAGYPGLAAIAGWDPATGWGTPNYGCLAGLM